MPRSMSFASITCVLFVSSALVACAASPEGPSTDIVPSVTVTAGTVAPAVFSTVGPISDEASHSFGFCPGQKAVYGMECAGRYCDNVYLYCDSLPPGVELNADLRWRTPWFSEEQIFGEWCSGTGPNNSFGLITGVACKGRYCDAMQLECTPLRRGRISFGFSDVRPPFSEEQPAQFWPNPAVGISCDGSYCDRLQVTTHPVQP